MQPEIRTVVAKAWPWRVLQIWGLCPKRTERRSRVSNHHGQKFVTTHLNFAESFGQMDLHHAHPTRLYRGSPQGPAAYAPLLAGLATIFRIWQGFFEFLPFTIVRCFYSLGRFHLMFPEIWKENCWNPTWWLRNLLQFKHSKIRVALIIIYHRWMTVVGYDKFFLFGYDKQGPVMISKGMQYWSVLISKGMQYCISATPYLQNRKHGQVRIKYKLINISYSYKYIFLVCY